MDNLGAAPAPRVTEGDIAANIVGEYYFTGQDGVAGVQALAAAAGNVHEITGLAPVVVVKAHPRLRDVTICVLVLRNAFVVVGTSVPVSPENFDAEKGRKAARANAVAQCWALMGYALREQLHATTPRTPIMPSVAAPVVVDTRSPLELVGLPADAERAHRMLFPEDYGADAKAPARGQAIPLSIGSGATTNAVHRPNEPQDPPDPVPPPPGGGG